MNLRSVLYRTARAIGDVRAIKKGSHATVKRVERRALGRLAQRAIAKLVGK